jgi:hypothetical protein
VKADREELADVSCGTNWNALWWHTWPTFLRRSIDDIFSGRKDNGYTSEVSAGLLEKTRLHFDRPT